mgnify:CR=1 FL=1
MRMYIQLIGSTAALPSGAAETGPTADVAAAPVLTQGPRIERHPRFPQRVNAGYMQVVDRATIRLRVWERGTGETPACGTGACAAVAIGMPVEVCFAPEVDGVALPLFRPAAT